MQDEKEKYVSVYFKPEKSKKPVFEKYTVNLSKLNFVNPPYFGQ
jgi:hypothetical protein